MNTSTKRKVRLNARFNFKDDEPERGFLNITGKVNGISELKIIYYYLDPNNPDEKTTPDGAKYNEKNEETIRLF